VEVSLNAKQFFDCQPGVRIRSTAKIAVEQRDDRATASPDDTQLSTGERDGLNS
jgi:hypothetical protein